MRNILLKAALIPILFSMTGLFKPGKPRKRPGSNPPGNTGQSTNVNDGVNRARKARPTKSHGAQQKREGIKKGPVRFSVPRKLEGKATAEHKRQAQEYVDAANQAREDGNLSDTGRVRPSQDTDLKAAKDKAARDERTRAENAGEPYGDQVAAHLPDTTWTGTADPPGGWGRHDDSINASLGSQSDKYPEGYQPTVFELDETWDDVPDE
jgi:hypothetical protein